MSAARRCHLPTEPEPSASARYEQNPRTARMMTNRPEHQLPINAVEIGFDVDVEHPVIPPAALTSLAHGIDRRFAGPVAIRVGMKHRLQTRLQVATDDFLGDTVSNRWHSRIELHFYPISLWVQLK
jgi:hypothetical protein